MATVKYVVLAHYIASKTGKAGLTVTVDIDEWSVAAGTVDTAFATAQAMTEARNGLYYRFFDGDDGRLYSAVAKTSDSSVDQQHLAAIVVRLDRINTTLLAGDYTAPLDATATEAAAAAALVAYDPATGAEVAAVPDALLDGEEVSIGVTVRQSLAASGSAADPLLNPLGAYPPNTGGGALQKVSNISDAALYSPATRANQFALAPAIQFALRPSQQIVWLTADGVALDLTDATEISGMIRNSVSGVVRAIAGTLEVTDADSGVFSWEYDAGDVADAGTFDVQFVATFDAAPTPARTFVATWTVTEALVVPE